MSRSRPGRDVKAEMPVEKGVQARGAAEWLALAAQIALVAAVSLVPGRIQLGPVPLDAVTVSVPLAVLLSWPFLRRLGVSRVPGLLVEVPALAFLGIAAAGALFAQGRGEALLTLTRYASYLLLVVCVAAVAVRPGNRRAIALGATACSAVSAGWAFWQYLRPTEAVTVFGVSQEAAVRVTAALGNPDPYAEFLVVMLAIVVSAAVTERGWLRWTSALVAVAVIGALLLTYTRGSWLALALGVLVASFMVKARWGAIATAVGAALVAVLPGGVERLTSLFDADGGIANRLSLWGLALELVRRHPLTGVGLGRYLPALDEAIAADPSFLPEGVPAHTAHNSFLQAAAETGVAGGLAFAWLALRILRSCGAVAVRLAKGTREHLLHAVYTAAIVAFVANAITVNTFQHPGAAVVFWLLVGLATANAVPALGRDVPAPEGTAAGLWALPRTRGRLLLDSAVGRLLVGQGASDAAELGDWEAVRA